MTWRCLCSLNESCLYNYSFTYSFIYLFIYLFIHLFMFKNTVNIKTNQTRIQSQWKRYRKPSLSWMSKWTSWRLLWVTLKRPVTVKVFKFLIKFDKPSCIFSIYVTHYVDNFPMLTVGERVALYWQWAKSPAQCGQRSTLSKKLHWAINFCLKLKMLKFLPNVDSFCLSNIMFSVCMFVCRCRYVCLYVCLCVSESTNIFA